MVKNYLNALKNKGNFTAKEIEKLSGIPEATIRKILSGETADPRFDTVERLVSAMGGSLNEAVEKKTEKDIEMNALLVLKATYEERIKDIKEHISSLRKDKRILAIVTACLIAFVIALLIIDISIGTRGWVRY